MHTGNKEEELMKKLILLGLALSLFASGCAVVNVYVTFPEEKIKAAAEDLLAPPSPKNSGSFLPRLFAAEAYAQEKVEVRKEVKTDSPVIRQAKSRMDSWWGRLDEFRKAGYIGEKNNFEVEVRQLPPDTAVAREVRQIASNENRERRVMMSELLKINNVPSGEEEKFKQVFGKVSQKNSPGGTWIQNEKGLWERK